ncbi:TonB family protein [Sphingobium sp. JS3065]|uniref:energy transducer TonB n=1 Tax=Sphingobium sp. JS3065 TaxID=2970925 RepID=UPI002264AE96|nr:TonB family protein [Sphingobium sp. JS3065]UZW54916.1 TonB family protein [Sphingobium sp. JS3065]
MVVATVCGDEHGDGRPAIGFDFVFVRCSRLGSFATPARFADVREGERLRYGPAGLSAPERIEAAPSPVPVPMPPPAPPASDGPDSWEGRVLAALNRHLRYPRDSLARREQGAPLIRFVMDRDGRVMSVRLRRTSGSPDLDREALSLPMRAMPLPKPPDDRPGATLELVVPIQFFLHDRPSSPNRRPDRGN